MKRRILLGFVGLVLAFALAATLVSGGIVLSVARDQLTRQLQGEMAQLQQAIAQRGSQEVFNNLICSSRVSHIAQDGSVLFDSWAQTPLENHADRPEFIDALAGREGLSVRYSDTTKSTAIYVARQLPDGSVLRVAGPEKVARGIASGMVPWLIFGLILLTLFCIPLAGWLTNRLLRPVLEIDLDHPEDARVYDEMLPLVRRLSEQNRQNRSHVQALEARRQELDTLLDGMHEGFVALDPREQIILINPSACRMLGIKEGEALGKQLPQIDRSKAILSLLADLRDQGSGEGTLLKDGRSYLLFASRIAVQGAAIIFSDQTDKIEGEAMRKRFTANVSHELRTPLTTLCGYAELLKNNMVQPGDMAQFHQIIYRESHRMLSLVEDILRLSRLDEGYLQGQRQKVNLHQVMGEVCQSLELAADEQGIRLFYEGQDAFVLGDVTLLDELCSNLVDNAIKYNIKDGYVKVLVKQSPLGAVLRVEDSGIGIEPNHQPRVFERFYRTDTSRSKETGGTGLGLSIVKHAAEFHKAKIKLDSQPGKGTTITVSFPPYQENP